MIRVTRVTTPVTGMRLTWTSAGDRKMLIWCQVAWGAASGSASAAIMTRPSAGDTTSSGPTVVSRSGSRKKKRKNAVSTSSDEGDREGAEDNATPARIARPQ